MLTFLTYFELKKNIELIEVCSDTGAGTHGACFGAEALQIMAKSSKDSFLSDLPKRTCSVNFHKGFTSDFARNIELVYMICKSISKEVSGSLLQNRLPLVISGDHSCAAGTIAGIKIARPDSRLGVVWIDAHADIHSPYTTPSGNMHGMPLAASLNEDNISHKRQDVDYQTNHFWQKIKKLGNIFPKVQPQDVVYISLRDFEKEEASLIRKHGVKVISTETLRRCGVSGVISTALKQLEFCSDIYVSFDTDCLDVSVSKGTGLPVPGGIMPWEAEELVAAFMQHPKIICFEVTELNPFFDEYDQSTKIISNILEKGIFSRESENIDRTYRLKNVT